MEKFPLKGGGRSLLTSPSSSSSASSSASGHNLGHGTGGYQQQQSQAMRKVSRECVTTSTTITLDTEICI